MPDLARCAEIAREVLRRAGMEYTDQEIVEMAADMQRFVETFPPRSREQLDRVAALLYPSNAVGQADSS